MTFPKFLPSGDIHVLSLRDKVIFLGFIFTKLSSLPTGRQAYVTYEPQSSNKKILIK